jgi:hypothetical protein
MKPKEEDTTTTELAEIRIRNAKISERWRRPLNSQSESSF